MEMILLALAIFVGLAGVATTAAVLVGARLPVGHRVTRQAQFTAPVHRVWDAIVDPADERRGGVAFEVVESVRPRRLVRKVVGERAFGGTWTYDVVAREDVSVLTITEDGEVYNPFFRFVSRYIIGHTRSMDSYVIELRRRIGEP